MPARVLLTEGSSLTAREHLTVLGEVGVEVELVSATSTPLAAMSRWCRRVHRLPAPSEDPHGYLAGVSRLISTGRYDAVLPTHEQAWLMAAGRRLLPGAAPIALAPIEAFDRVQGKDGFARLLDELGLPQPAWAPVGGIADVLAFGFPCWVKADHATAGRGVRLVRDAQEAAVALRDLAGRRVVVQRPAQGQYAQAGALFDRGRLVAVHLSGKVGAGAGGSAAARVGLDHPVVRRDLARLGAHLGWHGGLTVDYFHRDGDPQYLECNPRTVEPGNAAASGVNLPLLSVALARGDALPDEPMVGRPGVRTHSAVALVLGAAEATGRRTPAVAAAVRGTAGALLGRGRYAHSREVLTPVLRDPLSALPAALVLGTVLRRPAAVADLAVRAVGCYAVSPAAVDAVRAGGRPQRARDAATNPLVTSSPTSAPR